MGSAPSRRDVGVRRRPVMAAALTGLALLAGCDPRTPDPEPDPGPTRLDQPARCDEASPGAAAPTSTAPAVAGTSVVGTTWAGMPVSQSLLTAGARQYVAYYGADRTMTLAQRDVAEDGTAGGTWKRRRVGSTLGWDSHDDVTMAVDRAGALHVAGNMHGDPLVYLRTGPDGDISGVSRVRTMVSAETEQEVTYPVFLRGLDSTLFFC